MEDEIAKENCNDAKATWWQTHWTWHSFAGIYLEADQFFESKLDTKHTFLLDVLQNGTKFK